MSPLVVLVIDGAGAAWNEYALTLYVLERQACRGIKRTAVARGGKRKKTHLPPNITRLSGNPLVVLRGFSVPSSIYCMNT